jgi:cytochrome c553
MDRKRHGGLVKVLGFGVLLAAVSAWPQQPQGDPGAGHKKNHTCTGCHGIPGWRTAYPEVYRVPYLGGQSAAYIVAALKAYKAGQRAHASMQAVAASLTDQDMADIAAYYAGAGK